MFNPACRLLILFARFWRIRVAVVAALLFMAHTPVSGRWWVMTRRHSALPRNHSSVSAMMSIVGEYASYGPMKKKSGCRLPLKLFS